MIAFKEIYSRAINLLDDPDINRVFIDNQVGFCKIMYPFLVNGVSQIHSPIQVANKLTEVQEAKAEIEIFDGDGVSHTYALSMLIPDGADVVFFISNKIDRGATLSADKSMVTFSRVVKTDEKCAVEYYLDGAFIGDFSKVKGNFPLQLLINRVKDLLIRATVLSWIEKEKNFLLEIRNILNDTDFRLFSPSANTQAKLMWAQQTRREFIDLMNKLSRDWSNYNWKSGYRPL